MLYSDYTSMALLRIGIFGAQGHLGHQLTERLADIKPSSVEVSGTTDKEHNSGLAAQADLLIITVRPKDVAPLLFEISASLQPTAQILSFAAGVTIQSIASATDRPVARGMVDPWWNFAGFVLGADFSKTNYEFLFEKLAKKIIPLQNESDIDEFTAYFVHAYIVLFLKAVGELPNAEKHLEYLAPHLHSSVAELKSFLPEGEPSELLRTLTTPGGVTEAVLNAIRGDAAIEPARAHAAGMRRIQELK